MSQEKGEPEFTRDSSIRVIVVDRGERPLAEPAILLTLL